MNIVYISFMVPFLLLILDLTQIVSTVRTLRAGIFDLVKFPVSKIIPHFTFLSIYLFKKNYNRNLILISIHLHRMIFAMDKVTEMGHAIQGKSMLPI